jgi:LuxR family transcriptional activator of conjugal transfer of Ti plasmids
MHAGTAFGQLALLKLISRTPGSAAAAVIDDMLAAAAVAQLHAAFQRDPTRSTIAAPLELTAKQALCLHWSAESKSMRATTTLEEMTYSTVAFHLLAVRRTLDAFSLPQATAIATKLRLM